MSKALGLSIQQMIWMEVERNHQLMDGDSHGSPIDLIWSNEIWNMSMFVTFQDCPWFFLSLVHREIHRNPALYIYLIIRIRRFVGVSTFILDLPCGKFLSVSTCSTGQEPRSSPRPKGRFLAFVAHRRHSLRGTPQRRVPSPSAVKQSASAMVVLSPPLKLGKATWTWRVWSLDLIGLRILWVVRIWTAKFSLQHNEDMCQGGHIEFLTWEGKGALDLSSCMSCEVGTVPWFLNFSCS